MATTPRTRKTRRRRARNDRLTGKRRLATRTTPVAGSARRSAFASPATDSRLSLLAKVAGAIVGSKPLRQQAREMARQVCWAFGVDACVIRLLEGDELALLASAGIPAKLLYPRLPASWGVVRKIFSTARPMFIRNVYAHPITTPVSAHLRGPYKFTSYAGAPLLLGGQAIGILGIYAKKELEELCDADLTCLQVLANNITSAIVNERLYDGMKEQKNDLKLEVSRRKRMEAALRASREEHLDQMRRLARDTERLLEEERSEVSRRLHDGVGQSLTSLMMRLAWVERRLRTDGSKMADELQQAYEQAAHTIEDVRRIARRLRPIAIEHDGLIPAIRSYIAEFMQFSGVRCRLKVCPPGLKVGEPIATAAYRIIQEAMTNIARHSRATHCEIRLVRSSKRFELTILDDGRGAAQNRLEGHDSLGILGMKERASVVGGQVVVSNRPDEGVEVRASFPFTDEAQAPAGTGHRATHKPPVK